MFRAINAAALILCVGCVIYLLTHPMDRARFFLTRRIGKALFPKLDPYRQQQRIGSIVGLLLATILIAEIIAFVIKYLNRR